MKSTCLSLAFGLAALASTPAPGNAVIEAVFKTAEVLDSKNWTEGEPHLRAQGSPSPLYPCGEAGPSPTQRGTSGVGASRSHGASRLVIAGCN